MAALPEDMKNLEPQNTREWLQLINHKIDNLAESQQEDRELLEGFIDRVKCLETNSTTASVEISNLKARVNGWSLVNSIGVIIAAILAWLGLRG